jgi:hypothetical protein
MPHPNETASPSLRQDNIITDQRGGPAITKNEPDVERRNRSIRTCTTLEIENGQLKTSLDVPLSDAAADVLWRIIDRARKTRQT